MVWLILYLSVIVLANAAIVWVGVVPVWPGVMAPAGVYFAGLAFSLRDAVQETLGRRAVLAAIGAGAVLSSILSPRLALASGAAFLVSELADFAVYTPLRRRTLVGALVASNVVGLLLDSALFLWLAFGSLDFLPGQVIGKGWVTLASAAVVWSARGALPSRDR